MMRLAIMMYTHFVSQGGLGRDPSGEVVGKLDREPEELRRHTQVQIGRQTSL
jgi:hypothetical protein